MKTCAVPECPALATKGELCGVHEHASTAKSLNIHKMESGKGGQRCGSCGRVFRATDWVLKKMKVRERKKKTQPGNLYGYVHVACEPPTARLSKRKLRESPKPLLAACAE